MVMLVENQPMPSAGIMPRDRHGTYHVSMATPPPAVAAQPFSHQWDINDSTLPLVSCHWRFSFVIIFVYHLSDFSWGVGGGGGRGERRRRNVACA